MNKKEKKALYSLLYIRLNIKERKTEFTNQIKVIATYHKIAKRVAIPQ
jgi:hypothetical protein